MQKNERTYPTFFNKIIFASFNQLQISLILLCCSLGYIFLASIKLNATALHNDEMLFVNAAIGEIEPHFFVFKKIGNIPLLLMDYIGALKAWLYFPIFKLFGVNVWSLRLPMIFLTATGLFMLGQIFVKKLPFYIALSIVVLLCCDPFLIFHTRIDTGPNAIELFLKIVALYFFYRFLDTPNLLFIALIALILFLGVFNKLNFIWFVNSFALGLLVCYHKNMWDLWQKSSKNYRFKFISLLFSAYLLPFLYFAFISYSFGVLNQTVQEKESWANAFVRVGELLNEAHSGGRVQDFNYFLGFAGWTDHSWIDKIMVGLAVLMGSAVLIKQPYAAHTKHLAFIGLLLVSLLGQMLLTDRARYSWHIFMIYPFLTITVVLATSLFFKNVVGRFWLYGFVFAALLGLNLGRDEIYIEAYFKQKPQYEKMKAFNSLLNYTTNSPHKFVLIDGTCTSQLIGLSQSKNKYFDQSYHFGVTHKFMTLYTADINGFEQKFLTKPDEYYYIFSNQYGASPSVAPNQILRYHDFICYNFFDILKQTHHKWQVVETFGNPESGFTIIKLVG